MASSNNSNQAPKILQFGQKNGRFVTFLSELPYLCSHSSVIQKKQHIVPACLATATKPVCPSIIILTTIR